MFQELVLLLAPTLGQSKSEELVRGAAHAIGHPADELDQNTALLLLSVLSQTEGLVGVAARLAALRITQRRRRPVTVPEAMEPVSEPARPPPRVGLDRVKALLAPTLGSEKSEQIVTEAAAHLGLPSEIDQPQLMRLFDRLAQAQGIVATAAHFAKARLILTMNSR
jgi:hypothetical protein